MCYLRRHQRLSLGAGHDGVWLRADQAAVLYLHQLNRAEQDDRVNQ